MKTAVFTLLVLTASVGFARSAETPGPKETSEENPTLPVSKEDYSSLWSWCNGKEPVVFKNVEVYLKNYPLVPGKPTTAVIQGEVLEELDDLVVKSFVTVGRMLNLRDTQNLCRSPWNRCPMAKGYQVQEFTYNIPITLFSSVTTKSILYSAGEPVACMNLGPLVLQRR